MRDPAEASLADKNPTWGNTRIRGGLPLFGDRFEPWRGHDEGAVVFELRGPGWTERQSRVRVEWLLQRE